MKLQHWKNNDDDYTIHPRSKRFIVKKSEIIWNLGIQYIQIIRLIYLLGLMIQPS
jgi:hypothetical protein